MGKIIEDYDELVREAAKAYLEPGISEEIKAERRRTFTDLSKARNEALQAEHDFNNPAKECKDRILEYFKTVVANVSPVAAYLIVSWLSTVLEMGSYIQPNTVKDALRKCKPDRH